MALLGVCCPPAKAAGVKAAQAIAAALNRRPSPTFIVPSNSVVAGFFPIVPDRRAALKGLRFGVAESGVNATGSQHDNPPRNKNGRCERGTSPTAIGEMIAPYGLGSFPRVGNVRSLGGPDTASRSRRSGRR